MQILRNTLYSEFAEISREIDKNVIKKRLRLLEKDGVITFFMKYDHPIKLVYEISLTQVESNNNHSSSNKVKEIPIATFKAITYLAPRALEQDEEFDEDTEDEDDF